MYVILDLNQRNEFECIMYHSVSFHDQICITIRIPKIFSDWKRFRIMPDMGSSRRGILTTMRISSCLYDAFSLQ